MSYSIRRWLSVTGNLMDDTETAKTADEAIRKAEMLSGIFHGIITEDIRQQIREMEPGAVVRIRKPSIKFSMRIKRRMR